MPNYTTPPTAVAGFGLSAADWNSKIRDSVEDVAKPKRVKVNRNATQAIANAATTEIQWQNEEYDTDNMWSAASPNQIVIPAGGTGLWMVTLAVHFAINATGARHFAITQNGTVRTAFSGIGNGTWYVGGPIVTHIVCAVGDLIKGQVYQTSGGALNVDPAYPISLSAHQVAR